MIIYHFHHVASSWNFVWSLLLGNAPPVSVDVTDNPLPGDAARAAGLQGDGLGLEVPRQQQQGQHRDHAHTGHCVVRGDMSNITHSDADVFRISVFQYLVSRETLQTNQGKFELMILSNQNKNIKYVDVVLRSLPFRDNTPQYQMSCKTSFFEFPCSYS